MIHVYNFFGGRSTFFGFWFFVIGVVLAFFGKLETNYLALAGGLQTIISLRSIADDVASVSMAKLNGGNGGVKK